MFQRLQCLTKIHILFLLMRWYNHNALTLSHRKDSGPGQMGYWRVLTGLNLIVWLVVLCLAPESRTLCWQLVCAHRHACISFTVQALIALTLILICWDSVIARLRGYLDELVSPVSWCLTQTWLPDHIVLFSNVSWEVRWQYLHHVCSVSGLSKMCFERSVHCFYGRCHQGSAGHLYSFYC